MNQFSRQHVGKPMATVFTEYKTNAEGKLRARSEVINVATIQTALGNQFRITGIGSLPEAQELAMLLRAGALTAPLKILEERSIGPTLGLQNIEAGFTALAFGMAGMMLFMMAWYRKFGWVAITALVANLLMQVGMLAVLPGAVLTLPGIAGLVLTVGMAVDTHVLILSGSRTGCGKGVFGQRHRLWLSLGVSHHLRCQHHHPHLRRGALCHRLRAAAGLLHHPDPGAHLQHGDRHLGHPRHHQPLWGNSRAKLLRV